MIRIGVFTYLIYEKFNILDINIMLKMCILSIYILGCVWLTSQIRLVYKDYNYYKIQQLNIQENVIDKKD